MHGGKYLTFISSDMAVSVQFVENWTKTLSDNRRGGGGEGGIVIERG